MWDCDHPYACDCIPKRTVEYKCRLCGAIATATISGQRSRRADLKGVPGSDFDFVDHESRSCAACGVQLMLAPWQVTVLRGSETCGHLHDHARDAAECLARGGRLYRAQRADGRIEVFEAVTEE